MPTQHRYHYLAKTPAGVFLRDEISAPTRRLAFTLLEQRGYSDIAFLRRSRPPRQQPIRRANERSLTASLEKLLILYKSGIGLMDALELVAQSSSTSALWRDLAQQVEKGYSLGEAVQRYRHLLGRHTCTLISFGESGADLARCLRHAIDYRQRNSEAAAQINRIMVYPKLVGIVLVVMTLALLFWLMPLFAPLFAPLAERLPLFTRFLLAASDAVVGQALPMTLTSFGLILLWRIKRWRGYRWRWVGRIFATLPLVGRIYHLSLCAQWLHGLQVLLGAGCSLDMALANLSSGQRTPLFNDLGIGLRQQLLAGQPWADVIQRQTLLPRWCAALMAAEPSTPLLAKRLNDIDYILQQEIKALHQTYIRYIEPGLLFLLGGYVLALLLAIYAPLFQIGQSL